MTSLLNINRTATGGSIVHFAEPLSANQEYLSTLPLTTAERETVLLLLETQKYLDEQQTISIAEIIERYNFRLHTFNSRLRNLRKKGFLIELDFQFSDGTSLPRVKCEKLVLTPVIPDVAIIDSKSKNQVRNGNQLRQIRQRNTVALSDQGLKQLPRIDRENLPAVVRHMGNHPIEQLVNQKIRKKGRFAEKNKSADPEISRKFSIKTTTGGRDVVARIRTLLNIMDAEDLLVLFACYSLIYNYHESSIAEHLANNTLPKNLTPIHIDQILDYLGRTPGGPNRMWVRDCLQAIADTVFDLHGLADYEFGDTTLHGYAKHSYRCFEQMSPLVDRDAEIDPDTQRVVFGDDATIFLIKLPDNVFQSLIEGERTFSFPTESLKVPAIIFSLYLRFRARCRPRHYEDNLKVIYTKIEGYLNESMLDEYKIRILQSFRALDRKSIDSDHLQYNYDDDQKRITFNLWGYHGYIDMEENFVSVTVHEEEMLACCGSRNSEAGPTRTNELSVLYVNNNINKRISRQLSSVIPRRYKKFSVIYGNNSNSEFELHKYVDGEKIADLVDDLTARFNVEALAVEIQIQTDLDCIEGLAFNNQALNSADFDWMTNQLNIIPMPMLHTIEFIRRLSRRVTLHDELHDVVFNNAVPSDKLIKTVSEIVSSVNDSCS